MSEHRVQILDPFTALVAQETDDGQRVAFRSLHLDALPVPQRDVLVRVTHSSLNYKDALAVTGSAPILRSYPIVPGIDLAGVVVASSDPRWKEGDAVVATGWGLGEHHWGGYAQMARLDGDWLVRRPDAFDGESAMAIGTAGFTAMLSVMALEEHGVGAADGPVLVTGASGGVGGFAVALLAALSYEVVASTGRTDAADYFRALGAADVIHRDRVATPPEKGLGTARWAGAVDTVGSSTLATILATTQTHGSVAACGLAGGAELPTTVYPFILRGVNLLGIDSNTCPPPRRRDAWRRLAALVTPATLTQIASTHPLSEIEELSRELLAGGVRGRRVIDVDA